MDSTIEKQFYEHLLSLGFPPDSIIYEPAFKTLPDGKRYTPDFAVLDSSTREPLAIIEIKSVADTPRLKTALQQVRNYVSHLQSPAVRSYVAVPSTSGAKFDFYQGDEQWNPKKVDPVFVEASSLRSASIAERKEVLAKKKSRTIDSFFIVCYVVAGLALLIAGADLFFGLKGITILNPERLILLGTCAAFLIVPFLQKFKALGIEIERHIGKQDG